MDTAARAGSRTRGPRLLGTAAVVLGVLVLYVVGGTGGASAAAGPTDLKLTKTDSPDPVVQGNNLTYTIKVDNLGSGGTADATTVTVKDPLPNQVDFVSASTTAGTCSHAGGTVTCELGTLAEQTSATVTIVVKTKKSGTISNTATVTTDVIDSVASNNASTATTTVTKPVKAPKKPKAQATCTAPTIVGTTGPDVVNGTSHADVIATFGGNDQVFAGNGKDLVCAGAGADLVTGGDKSDTLIGGGGRDRLFGNQGNDLVKGKAGRDRLRGNAGDDTLIGGKNRDNCRGGAGSNILRSCP